MDCIWLDRSPHSKKMTKSFNCKLHNTHVYLVTKNGKFWLQTKQITSCATSNQKWKTSVANWTCHP